MKKTLLTITAITALVGNGFAQFKNSSKPAPKLYTSEVSNLSENVTLNNSASESNLRTNAAGFTDTVIYFSNKRTFLTPPSAYVAAYALYSSYDILGGKAPYNPAQAALIYPMSPTSTISVKSIGAPVFKMDNSSPNFTVTMSLCSVDASLTPVFPALASADAVITTTSSSTKYANFASPVNVSGNFAVLVQMKAGSLNTDSVGIIQNYAASLPTWTCTPFNFSENLSIYKDAVDGNYYSSIYGASGEYKFEYTIRPVADIMVESDFTSVASGTCAPVTYTNTNTSSNLYTNRFFNFNKFMTNFTPTVAINGNTVMPTYTPVYSFNTTSVTTANSLSVTTVDTYTAGVYSSSLTANYRKHWNYGASFASNSTTTFTVNVCTGINELTSTELVVYPNPTTGLVNIKNLSYNSTIELYNVLGDLIYKEKHSSESVLLDLTKYTSGNYFLKVTSNEGTSTMKKLILN